jgi:glutamate N-acetyltransferase / amino-acid N-acetyltransferase
MSTLPLGYRAAGLPRHDRPRPSRHGLAIFYSEIPAAAAACFTTNIVKSVHIPLDEERLKTGQARVIMANSGCANCCTGRRGIREAQQTIAWASDALGVPQEKILVASTGVIGDFMPMDLLKEEIPMLSKKLLGEHGLQAESFNKAAEAIMTTDTAVKIAHASIHVAGREVHLWGCAKGAGMIHPSMTLSGHPHPNLPPSRGKGIRGKHATMLAFLLTDLKASAAELRSMLARATDASFNRVTVDGDTSTNDSVFLLANGASGAALKRAGDRKAFYGALQQICIDLSKKIAKDGEGASKFLEIRIEGARSQADAQRMAMTVATSPLVKTAAHGEDSNWGRILAAMGRSGVPFDPERADISFGDLCVFRQGAPTDVSAEKAREPLKAKEVTLLIRLHAGKAQGSYWTCDFTGQYVDINARYRT